MRIPNYGCSLLNYYRHAQKIGYNGPQIQTSIQSTPSFYRFEYIECSPDVQPPTDAESQALLAWANSYLKAQDLPATNLSSDFTNGVRLCMLAESVTGGGVGLYVKEPVLPWHGMQLLIYKYVANTFVQLCKILV